MKAENTPAAKAAFPEPPRKAGLASSPGRLPSEAPEAAPGRGKARALPHRRAPGRPSLATLTACGGNCFPTSGRNGALHLRCGSREASQRPLIFPFSLFLAALVSAVARRRL